MALAITKDNFDDLVKNSSKPVLVDFWATWCGPCQMIAPIIEELADEYDEKAIVGKINVDDESELASKFKVMSIPTVMVFKGGEVVDKVVGLRSKEDFTKMLNAQL